MPADREPDWSWAHAWLAEAAFFEAIGEHKRALDAERIAMGAVDGAREYIALGLEEH